LNIPNFLFIFYVIFIDMKKIVITESQYKKIGKLISEQEDNRYGREVDVNIEAYGVTYKGQEINDITSANVRLSYLIEQEHRSWGIKGISLYDIKGPEILEIEVDYFTDEDNTADETIQLQLDWSNVETEDEEGQGVVTVGNEITISLINDANGNIVIESVHVPVYSL
jgi:hypothetical protein